MEKAINMIKLITLVQGDMIVVEYENKFRNLIAFVEGVKLSKVATT